MDSTSTNLSLLYPLEPLPILQTRVELSAQQSFKLYREPPPPDDASPFDPNAPEDAAAALRNVTVEVQWVNRKGIAVQGDLATFPYLYYTPLYIIHKKWGFYYRLYEALAAIVPRSPELASRQLDLQDHWLREVLYLERVLEVAIQWTETSEGICRPLVCFVHQEDASTDHSLENTREQFYDVTDLSLLERCKSAHLMFYVSSLPLAIDEWIAHDDGSRSWLEDTIMARVDGLAQAVLETARAEAPVSVRLRPTTSRR